MTPFRWASSALASVRPGGSESMAVGAVCVSVIADVIVGRLCEKAAVITLVAAVILHRSHWSASAWSWCCMGCLPLALRVPHVCGLPRCHRGLHSSPCCSASWPRGWSQAGAAAGVGCGLLGPRAQELPYGRTALQLQPTLKTAE